ncbi:hypothetical protein LMJ53_08130 [Rheinheimera sp. UJ51]|uniref:hypothetical protein n=1 Tax=Rheinheimera sp. UJ51 TaxID=2892446 RepID=UPI001E4EC6CA|nr:hypothetical protein [Rheinheimera sp. UJ51]MCC5451692.1 hypothetical protein [Rheinheimera sp. UJ51]
MTQSNVVDLKQSHLVIDLIDNASRLGKQAKAVLDLVFVYDESFELFETEKLDMLLWGVSDRLDDIAALFNGCSVSELFTQRNEAAKYADQANTVICGLQELLKIDGLSKEVVMNALWFVSDRIDDILKLTSEIKLS